MADDPRRQSILRRLRQIGEGPYSYFLDACCLAESDKPDLKSRSHLVSHLLRETLSGLQSVFATLTEGATLPPNTPDSHAKKIRAILKILELDAGAGIGKRWLDFVQYGLAGRAHRRALAAPRPTDEEFFRAWREFQDLLDGLLTHFESHFLGWERVLDQLVAWETPGKPTVSRLRNDVPNNVHNLDYFFTRAGANWLAPLLREEFFKYAPPPDEDPDERTISFPLWPAGQYLARMAKVDGCAALVGEAILQVEPVRNPRVWDALLDAACSLPPNEAARAASHLLGALRCPIVWGLPEKLAMLAARLVPAGFDSEALILAKELLALSEPTPGLHEGALSRDAAAKFDVRTYEEVLSTLSPVLVPRMPEAWVQLLCEMLERCIRVELGEEREPPRDYSTTWRRHVGHARRRADLKNALVTAVRDACTQAIADAPCVATRLLRIIEHHRWSIFARIGLLLLARQAQSPVSEAEARLTNQELWTRDYPEYRELLAGKFGALSEVGRQTILGWVKQGPDREAYKRWHGPDASEGLLDRLEREWRHNKLTLLESSLPSEWLQEHERLTAEFGKASPLSVPEPVAVWSGSKSPKTAQELRSMIIPDLVKLLETWEPPKGERFPPGESREGLGLELSRAVTESPETFSAAALSFRDVPSVFISRLLDGLVQSKALERFDWASVLDLCLAVVRRLDSSTDEGRTCRLSVVWLVKEALTQGTSMPADHRGRVWALLELLSTDPDPSPEREETDNEPRSIGLNAVRSCAVEGVILYALWLLRHRERQAAGGQPDTPAMPAEAAQLLARHLDLVREPSVAVRDVFGRYFPQLHWLDAAWAEKTLESIFPAVPDAEPMWSAAWGGYLESGGPYTSVWPLLRSHYAKHVRLLAGRPDSQKLPRTDEELAFHLGALLWLGELAAADELLATFFANAKPKLRGWLLDKIGEVLLEEEPTGPTRDALMQLWETRVGAGAGAPETNSEELCSFGSWWSSGRFDREWADRQLLGLGSLGIQVERPDQVFKKLAEVAASEPAKALELLDALITDKVKDWTVMIGQESVEAVIRPALGSSSTELRRSAEQLVNKLVAWGFPMFKGLLTPEK